MTQIFENLGLCFSPFREGQSPITEIYPTIEQVEGDCQLIKQFGSQKIRTYSMFGKVINIAQIAQNTV